MFQRFLRRFKTDVSGLSLPVKFNDPFNYEPHPLCQVAAKELQNDLEINTLKGKMYGVLVVETSEKELGYLVAISGNQNQENHINYVPPIYDATQPNGFFNNGEQELTRLNNNIELLENSDELAGLKQNIAIIKESSEKEIIAFKDQLKKSKIERDKKRKHLLSDTNDNKLFLEQLIKESKTQKSQLVKLKKQWKTKIDKSEKDYNAFLTKIEGLKEDRKSKSALLQQTLFKQYRFFNAKTEQKDLLEIFEKTEQKVPPAAAGDCAAPKLLQFAYNNNLKPVAMAEFWWGPSPKSEVRKHGYYYPACQLKCKPILGFMLQGLNVDEKKQLQGILQIEVVFEDAYIAIINKPAGLLSVPGKEETESVLSQTKKLFPLATGPIIVHRLDMATSGLMLIAKNKVVHESLQKQFLDHTIQKRYVAVLDGEIKEQEGFIELPLRVDLNDRPRQLVCYEQGKPTKTKYKVIKKLDGKTRIHFFPITGRTHQLRIHSAHHLGLNSSIIGDELYGKKANRLHLHAESLSFIHPATGKKMTFTLKADF